MREAHALVEFKFLSADVQIEYVYINLIYMYTVNIKVIE